MTEAVVIPPPPAPPRPSSRPEGRLPLSLLVGATIAFLSLPVAIFLLGWLRAPLALLSTGALVASAWAIRRRLVGSESDGEPGARSLRAWLELFAGAGVLTLVVSGCGVGGFGVQTWDWAKHEAILADLVVQPWPVTYRIGQAAAPAHDAALVYYVAFYLPAALVGSVCGWRAAHVALFLWSACGLLLCWQWIARLGRASPWMALALLILFAAFDLPGALLAPPLSGTARGALWLDRNPEFRHGLFLYPGNLTQILYAPNQALGGWLSTALVLEALRRGARRASLALPILLCLLWSPFAALGLAALAALYRLALAPGRVFLKPRRMARGPISRASLLGLVGVALPLVLYFAARASAVDLPADLSAPPEGRAVAGLRFLPAVLGARAFAAEWVRFAGLELLLVAGPLAVLLFLARRRGGTRFDARLLTAAVALLAVLPLLTYGFFNDWSMRVSIPPIFALQVLAARGLSRRVAPWFARLAVLVVLLGLAAFPMIQLRGQVATALERGKWIRVPARGWVQDLFALQRDQARYYPFVEQYLGRTDTAFFRLLARPSEPRPIEPRAVAPPAVSAVP